MRRKLSLILAFVGLLGMIGFTPAANANHDGGPGEKNLLDHENSPSPAEVPAMEVIGECAVLGEVAIDDPENEGGVALVPQSDKNHNHFQFNDTQINCVSTDQNFTGQFTVHAAGGTDGQGECDDLPGKDPKCQNTTHGEDSSSGWSHSDCYAAAAGCVSTPKGVQDLYAGTAVNPAVSPAQPYNFNEIAVSAAPGNPSTAASCLAAGATGKDDVDDTCANWLKFCRGVYDDNGDMLPDCSNVAQMGTNASTGGSNVLAWGQLNDTSGAGGPPLCFLADLEFTPSSVKTVNDVTKVDEAVLEGTATIWHPPVAAASCEEGKKNKT